MTRMNTDSNHRKKVSVLNPCSSAAKIIFSQLDPCCLGLAVDSRVSNVLGGHEQRRSLARAKFVFPETLVGIIGSQCVVARTWFFRSAAFSRFRANPNDSTKRYIVSPSPAVLFDVSQSGALSRKAATSMVGVKSDGQ
jgi:hypothetical protein